MGLHPLLAAADAQFWNPFLDRPLLQTLDEASPDPAASAARVYDETANLDAKIRFEKLTLEVSAR